MFYISRILQSVAYRAWLLLLSVFSQIDQDVAGVRPSFFFMAKDIPLYRPSTVVGPGVSWWTFGLFPLWGYYDS